MANTNPSKKGKDIIDLLRDLTPLTWDLMTLPIVSKSQRTIVEEIQAKLQKNRRAEADDSVILLEIARIRRASPTMTVSGAVRQALENCKVSGTLQSGDLSVKLGERTIAYESASKHLEQKYKRHEALLSNKLDQQEFGRAAFRQRVGGSSPSARGLARSGPPKFPTADEVDGLLDEAVRFLSKISR
jgi:hypothetical protein